jgi:hypothetical protein
MTEIIYPTEWCLGKPRGSIKENPTNYQLRISTDNENINLYFKFCNYKSKKDTYNDCLKQQMIISDRHSLTRNKIRYLDKDTIEVVLTQDQKMITDSKFIEQVEKYPLNVKMKKISNKNIPYVMCQDKKKTFPFTDLITNYKNIRYKNNNTLDLRSNNINEFGKIELNKNITEENNYELENQFEYFELYNNNKIDKLPLNTWILGKPSGSIFHKNNDTNIYTICVLDKDQKQHTKTLNIKDFNNSHDITKKEADKLKINMSYHLGVTKNLIKIHDDYLEVQIEYNSKTLFMKINKFLLKLIMNLNVCMVKSGTSNISYPMTVISNKNILIHKLITQYNDDYLVDHINGDTLDNRYCNLRPVNHSLNNINKHIEIKGYKEVDTIFGKAIKVSAKLDKKEYSKYYSVSKNGYDNAVEMAKQFREKIKKINNYDINFVNELNTKEDKIILKYLYKIAKKQLSIIFTSINCNKNDFIKNMIDINLDKKYLNKFHNYYLYEQFKIYNFYFSYNECIKEKIKQIMYDHFVENIDNRKKFYLFKKL